jgi:hypothetical protein
MPELERDIAAFEKLRPELEQASNGRWVIFREGQLVDTFDSFQEAAETAVRRFGRGPFLIRQVGAPALTLPASVMYHPV